MRLGGPVFEEYEDPDGWIAALRRAGYRAAFCPVNADQGDEVIQAYARAAEAADVVIAEVGAWSDPLSPDEDGNDQHEPVGISCVSRRCLLLLAHPSRYSLWSSTDAGDLHPLPATNTRLLAS